MSNTKNTDTTLTTTVTMSETPESTRLLKEWGENVQKWSEDVRQGVEASAYRGRRVIPFVVRIGKRIDPTMGKALRHIIELAASKIEGLSAGLEVEEARWGFTRVKYAGEDLTADLTERYGKPLSRCLTEYARLHLSSGLPGAEETLGVLFVEPDPTFTQVVDAWYYDRFRVKQIIGLEASRDLLDPDPLKHSNHFQTVFTGDIHRGQHIEAFATKVLDAHNASTEFKQGISYDAEMQDVYAAGLAEAFPTIDPETVL